MTGTAAHICAAAPGGPRYDPTMSAEERSSYANGIWMCRTHGTVIDRDPAHFTVELLRAWKREAERDSWRRVSGVASLPSLPVPFGKLAVRFREAAQADLAAFQKTAKSPSTSVALTLQVNGIEEPVSTVALARAAQTLDDLILVAPPGMGKTTTLFQIAEGMLAGGNANPVLVSLGDWATEGRGLVASILARRAYASLSEEAFSLAADMGAIVLLLDGWNELESVARERARAEIETLKAHHPRVGLVVSTRKQALDVPFEGQRIELLPLSDSQQLAIARALRDDQGATLLDRAWRTPGVRDLIPIPLYLSALLSLPANEPFPSTREEVLSRFVAAHEKEPRRAEALRLKLRGLQARYLEALAVRTTELGGTSISEDEARGAVSNAARNLVTAGQIAAAPEPDMVLDALVDNHALMRAGDSAGLSFQHQQFQEWYASHGVERRIRAAANDSATMRALQVDVMDVQIWEEAILFAIERLARGDAADIKACAGAVLAAFEVDPMLSAEMIYRGSNPVWEAVANDIEARVNLWHQRGTCDRAQRFMMNTGRDAFIDRLWPLISHENKQISLKALRNCRRFRPSLLGADGEARIRALAPEPRATLLAEAAFHGGIDGLDLATRIATTDADRVVQKAVVDALSFRLADRHLTELLRQAPDSTFDRIVRRNFETEGITDPDILLRLAAARSRATKPNVTVVERLRAIVFDDSKTDVEVMVRDLIGELEIGSSSRDPAVDLIWQAHRLWPQAVAEGVLLRLRNGLELFYGADDLLAGSHYALEEEALLELALAPGERNSRAEAAASVLGPAATGRLIKALIPLSARLHDRSQPFDQAVSDRYHELVHRLTHVPGASLAAAAEAASTTANTAHLVLLAKLLARHSDDGSERSRPFDQTARTAVQALAKHWAERLLACSDASRHDVAEIASLIAQVPDPAFLPLLRRMLDENLAQYAAVRAEAAASGWAHGRAPDEASWPCTGEYFQAFVAIDVPETRELMREYLANPHFGELAARVILAQWVRANEPPKQPFGSLHDFGYVRQRRAERLLNPSISSPDAEAIFSAVETLIAEGSSEDQLRLGVSLACHAARLPHGERAETIARLLAVASRRQRAELIARLIQSGEVIPTEVVATGIEETFDDAKSNPWILHENNSYQLTDWIELLPFTDDLDAMIEVVRSIPEEHRPPNRLEKLLSGLVETPTEGPENALFALTSLDHRLSGHWAWYNSIFKFESPSAVLRLVAMIVDGAVEQPRSDTWPWARDLGSAIERFPAVRAEVYRQLRAGGNQSRLGVLAGAVAGAPDGEGLLLLIDLERRWGRRLFGWPTVEHVVTAKVPSLDWKGAYEVVPIAAVSLRRQLFSTTHDGGPKDAAAFALTTIDCIRDEHGRALDEPRHPDLASRRPWPILVPDPEASPD